MLRWQRKLIEENTHHIVMNLDISEVVPYLQSKGQLKDHHVAAIQVYLPTFCNSKSSSMYHSSMYHSLSSVVLQE